METTASQRSSHVQGGITMENRGGNTTSGVEICDPVLLFGKLWQELGCGESEKFGYFC